mmetsp:Transcript_17733/g.35395  ORF Transcript_17733/g.35395 Transcript_17733/m.35395 type:complete len:264 (-) Transcript_17733:649-1440(-)
MRNSRCSPLFPSVNPVSPSRNHRAAATPSAPGAEFGWPCAWIHAPIPRIRVAPMLGMREGTLVIFRGHPASEVAVAAGVPYGDPRSAIGSTPKLSAAPSPRCAIRRGCRDTFISFPIPNHCWTTYFVALLSSVVLPPCAATATTGPAPCADSGTNLYDRSIPVSPVPGAHGAKFLQLMTRPARGSTRAAARPSSPQSRCRNLTRPSPPCKKSGSPWRSKARPENTVYPPEACEGSRSLRYASAVANLPPPPGRPPGRSSQCTP